MNLYSRMRQSSLYRNKFQRIGNSSSCMFDKTGSVKSIMTHVPLETAYGSDYVDTIIRTMTLKGKSSVLILNELKHPEGIITERDIVRS